MGAGNKKIYKNYSLPTLAQEKIVVDPKRVKPSIAFYEQNLIPKHFEVPGHELVSQKPLKIQTLQAQIYAKPEYLKLLTYNVWFEGHNIENRYECILKMLADSNADIICLQEVNQQFLNLLHPSNEIFKSYAECYMPIMPMHWYDTLILSKYPCKFYKIPFPTSTMGRCNLVSVIQFAQPDGSKFKLGVNCVHLQSLNSTEQRIKQLNIVESLNEEMDMCIIAGDFNFSDGWKEDKAISSFTDIWKTGVKHFSKWANEEMRDTGFTMPTTERFPAWRPDHIVYKYKNKQLQPQNKTNEIEIIGDFTIPLFQNQISAEIAKDNIVRTPSDHFGLLSKIYL